MDELSAMRASSGGSDSPARRVVRQNPVLKSVAKVLAREMIKKSVPKAVFENCADAINKAFNIDDMRMANH